MALRCCFPLEGTWGLKVSLNNDIDNDNSSVMITIALKGLKIKFKKGLTEASEMKGAEEEEQQLQQTWKEQVVKISLHNELCQNFDRYGS